jgi:hypothetical protein
LVPIPKKISFWTKQGNKVATYPSAHPFGNTALACLDVLFGRKNFGQVCIAQGEEMQEEKYGTFGMGGRHLVLQDPQLI